MFKPQGPSPPRWRRSPSRETVLRVIVMLTSIANADLGLFVERLLAESLSDRIAYARAALRPILSLGHAPASRMTRISEHLDQSYPAYSNE